MNTEKKIEQYLRAAPRPLVPDGLLGKLQADVPAQKVKTQRSALRRWFAPAGGSISLWRVAAAIAIAIAVLLPLSYGATKLIKRFIAISQLTAIKLDFPYSGALSPDGKHFAGNTWNSRLTVIDTSTGEQRNLAENCYGPIVWSADGSEIAVVSNGEEKETLVAVSLKTGKTRTLIEDPPLLADWSPDGKFILGVKTPRVSVYSAVLVNLENKKESFLAEETGERPSPRFSPNGDSLSYVTKEANRSILHLRQIDGTSHVKYTDFPGDISQPIWSPDGTHIVFTGAQEGIGRWHKDLWAFRVEGNRFVGAPFPVVPDVEQKEFYNWSQNGQLAYRTGFRLGGIFTLPVDSRTGKATGAPRQLVRAGGVPSHCWSPDGKQIAVRQGGELSFISVSTSKKKRNLSLPDIESKLEYGGRGMSWSPDGRLIVFSGWDTEKRTGIFLITVKTGALKLLVPLETRIPNFDPTWAPDSKTIAYGYESNVYVVNIEDGKPRRITASEEREHKGAGRPVFVPDGRSVAYMAGQRILATTIDGQETREIFHLKNKKFGINIFDWSPDGRHIVFTPGNKDIWCVATDGGEPFQIADISNLGDEVWSWLPKWSPTGEAIAFMVYREKHQYWVMENFLPAAKAAGR
jgi:Tol biopolymer transport system component